VFVDSTALIHAANSDELLNLLIDLHSKGCLFFSIPSVVYEYARTANTPAKYKERLAFIKGLDIAVLNRVEEILVKEEVFHVAYNMAFSGKSSPSYADSLICAMAYKYHKSKPYILTANHSDIPPSMFDRKELITIDIKGGLQNEALYQFSETKFSSILTKLEKQE